jgi:hypothetical protein
MTPHDRALDKDMDDYLAACDDPRTDFEIEHDLMNADEADVEKYISKEEHDALEMRRWMKGEDV